MSPADHIPYSIRALWAQNASTASTLCKSIRKRTLSRNSRRKNYRQNQAAKIGVKVLSLNSDEISERGSGVDVIPDETVHVEEDAILSSEIHDLHAALSQLDPVSYGLIHSYYLAEDHKTESQIAEELGVSQSAVHKQKKKRLKKLKKWLLNYSRFCNRK